MDEIINKKYFDKEFVNEINKEFEDLISFLHKEKEREEYLIEKFSKAIADSMPKLCELFSIDFDYDDRGNEFDEIRFIFKNE